MSPLLLLLTALPPTGTYGYTLQLGGAPAAQVDLEVGADALVYRRTFFFSRGPQHDQARFKRAEGDALASFLLLTPLKKGCVEARDESSAKRGKLCVSSSSPDEVKGTLFEQAFSATYVDGVLDSLELPTSKYVRGVARKGADFFGKGFEVQGSGPIVALYPPFDGARQHPVSTLKGVKAKGNCLERAEAVIAQSKDKYELVLGLVEDGDQMWPHAWLIDNESRAEWDPTLPNAEKRVYLEFPRPIAGQLYLELLEGHRQVVRAVAVEQDPRTRRR